MFCCIKFPTRYIYITAKCALSSNNRKYTIPIKRFNKSSDSIPSKARIAMFIIYFLGYFTSGYVFPCLQVKKFS